MSNTKRPYTGFDKVGTATHPAAKKLAELLEKRHGMNYMGGLVVRVMRSAPAAIQKLAPTDPKCAPFMSVHATGRAIDIGLNDAGTLAEIFDYLVANADELFLEEVHNYSWKAPGAKKAWGRGYRCSRGGGKTLGVVAWDATNNGGTPGGLWLHAEVSPNADPAKLEAHFRATKAAS
jgi:hypothetical protein